MPDIINQIRDNEMQKLLENGQRLLLELRPMKEYIYKSGLMEFNEENQIEDAIVLNKLNQIIEEAFTSLESLFAEIRTIVCTNYLEVNALRRNFFIALCKVIVGLEGSVDVLAKMNDRKGQSPLSLPALQNPVRSINEFYYLDSAILNKFDILTSKDFRYFQEGFLTFPVKDSTICIPIDEEDSLSIIAYALSSENYYKEIEEFLEDSDDLYDKIESNLLAAKEDHFVYTQSNYDESEFQDNPQKENFKQLYGDCVTIKVTAYFCKQFHGLRQYCVGSHLDYLLSISKCQEEELHLGKSKAYFKNTLDERFMIKMVGERQFRMFMDFAPNYFRHSCKRNFHGMPSCLVKILGAYSVSVKNHDTGKSRQEWLFISENLCYNLPKTSHIYDLKGTINRRRKVQEGDERTKMDLNFVEFSNGLPIILGSEDKKILDAEI